MADLLIKKVTQTDTRPDANVGGHINTQSCTGRISPYAQANNSRVNVHTYDHFTLRPLWLLFCSELNKLIMIICNLFLML